MPQHTPDSSPSNFTFDGLSRRAMLGASALALAALAARPALSFGARPDAPAADPHEGDDTNIKPADKKLKILVLGGTAFIGPHFVRLALRRGHSVAVFNRGKTEKRIGALPESVEKLLGDRDPKVGEGLKALDNDRTWDAVVDNSGYIPRHVTASANLLSKRAGQYLFVSSISAYANPVPMNADETAPLAPLDDPDTEDMAGGANYGGLKALCERAAEKAMPGKVTNLRPTFIVGPGDPTDRFVYWPARVAQGGKMLCPGTPDGRMQYVDVRDLAAFMLKVIEDKAFGDFNVVGPAPTPASEGTIGTLLAAAKRVSKSDAEFVWMDEKFVLENASHGSMTIWLPNLPDYAGMATVKFDKALKAGLKNRPVEVTVRDTLEWWPKELERRARVTKEIIAQAEKDGKPKPVMPDPSVCRAGMKRDEENRLLEKWAELKKG